MINVLNKTLEEVRPVVKNSANEVTICKDVYTNEMFVVIKLIDRRLIKRILGLLYAPDGSSLLPDDMFVGNLVNKENVLLVFRYLPERRLFSYLKSESRSAASTIETVKDLIISYFALKVAPPLIGLLIDEDNINVRPDGSIYFGTILDFENINFELKETDCSKKMIDIINKMLLEFNITENGQYANTKSIMLFLKKYRNNTYGSLVEVYNDFKLDGAKSKRGLNWFKKIIDEETLFKLGKKILIITAICMICIFVKWLLEKSTLMIGFRNNNLDLIGTVNMTEE